MKKLLASLIIAFTVIACASPPSLMVYSSGFSFANYDYVVIGKSEGRDTNTSLYGMDVEFANLMSRFNMRVIGDKEYESLSPDVQKRTLNARMSVNATDNRIVLAISFDDAVSGRTGASITNHTDGDIFDVDDRVVAFESASETLIKAIEKDKGLEISR